MKIEKCQQAASTFMRFKRITKEYGSFINLPRKGLTQEILQSRLKIFPFLKDARFETSSVFRLVRSCSRFCDSAYRSPSDGLLHLGLR